MSFPSAAQLRSLMPSNDIERLADQARIILEDLARQDVGQTTLYHLIGVAVEDRELATSIISKLRGKGYIVNPNQDQTDAEVIWST